MKKRLLSVILTIAMLSSLVFSMPLTASASTGVEGTNILVYDGVVSSITTSLASRSESYHPATRMIDGSLTGDNYFKTSPASDREDDLVVTIKLTSSHSINGVVIYERFIETTCSDSVTVQVGTASSLVTAASGLSLSSGGTGIPIKNEFAFGDVYTGDTIVVTFEGGKGGKSDINSQYEIYEIEAYENISIEGNILASHTENITTSIACSSSTYHNAQKMVDGSFSGDDYYKSANTSDDNTDLVVTIDLDTVCLIGQIKVFERYLSTYGNCTDSVKISLGTEGNMTTSVSGGTLESAVSTGVVESVFNIVPKVYCNKIEITFEGTEDRGTSGECTYQIYEIEAYSDAESEVYMYAGSPRARVDGYVRIIDDSNISVVPEVNNSKFYAPADFIAPSLKLDYEGDSSQCTISEGDLSVSFSNGDNSYTKNGHLYISVADMCEALDVGYEYNPCGLFFAGNFAAIDWNNRNQFNSVTAKLRDVVYGAIPLPDDVTLRLKEQNPDNKHPRLMLPGGFSIKDLRNRILYEPYKTWADTIISNADKYIELTAEDPFEYEIPDGIRLLSVSERAMKYIECIAFAYLMTGDEKYAQGTTDILMTVCSFPNWNEKHFLDVGKMSGAVALGYDWCYDYLSESQKETIRTALVEFALKPVMKDYNEEERTRTYYWSSKSTSAYPNNWIAVCVGGTTMAALAIGDEDLGDFTDAGKVITEGMDRLKDLLDTYLPDGGFLDGYSYWRFAMEYIGNFVGCMNSALGTDYNISASPGLHITFEWIQQLTGPAGPFNFDTCGSAYIDSPEFILFGNITDNPAYVDFRVGTQIGKKGIPPSYKDILWYDSSVEHTGKTLPYEFFSRGATNLYVTKAGNNTNDAWASMYVGYRKKAVGAMQDFDGTFILDMLGTRWAIDYGGEGQTYHSTGYSFCDYYICRAEGHNTIILTEGDDHDHDPYACGKLLRSNSNDRSAYAVYDFTDQLDDKGASLWHRGMKIDRLTQKVTVQDRLEIADGDSMFYWFMHTGAEIEISSDGKSAILTKGTKQIKATLISDDSSLVFTEMEAKPLPNSPNPDVQESTEGTRKLAVHSESISAVNMAVEFVPLENGSTDVETEALADMNSWTLKGPGVKVTGSCAENDGSGEYQAGDTVTVYAGEKENTVFSHWEAEGITLSDPTSPTQTFTMPSNYVVLEAKWKGYDFIDINFDNWTSSSDFKDSDGSATGLNWQSSYKPQSTALYTDATRTTQSLKVTVDSSSSNNHNRIYMYPQNQSSFGDYVLWTEISVKFEDQFVGFGWDHNMGLAPVRVGTDGKIYYFSNVGKTSHVNGGTPLNYQLELGKWYHIVLAMDCANAPVNDGGPLHLWVNGEKLCNGEAKYTNSNFRKEIEAFKYIRFVIENPDSGQANVSIDNFRFYTTDVVDTHPSEEFENISLETDEFYVDFNNVYITKGMTADEFISDALPNQVKIVDESGNCLSDEVITRDDKIYVNSSSGIGYAIYNPVPGFACTIIADSIYHTDSTFLVDCVNTTGQTISAKLFVAKYENSELSYLSQIKDITIPAGRSEIESPDISFAKEGEAYKVFIWEDTESAKPLCISEIFTRQ